MAAGIKLYKHFTDELNKLGKLRRIWFTTFNLNIHFFEKYILSAITGYSYREMRTALDYEAISEQLSYDEEELRKSEKTEVRVFYDYRALEKGNHPKQTIVQLHPVDIRQVKGIDQRKRFSEGVFHPKVIVAESVSGEYWVMASSANLTFGGWSNNREAFFCERLDNKNSARALARFFEGLTAGLEGFQQHRLIEKLSAGQFGEGNGKWYFFSSFEREEFLEKMIAGKNPTSLHVWSPYFSNDLSEITKMMKTDDFFEKVTIIPALTEQKKIRIPPAAFSKCQQSGFVDFMMEKPGPEEFSHAKVWMTPMALAIGSWNMTFAGMNISRANNNNIEAGIIYSLTSREYQAILADSKTVSLRDASHLSENELDEEKKDLLDPFVISLELMADWTKLEIRLLSPTYHRLIKEVPSGSRIVLPGAGAKPLSILEVPFSFRDFADQLLADRYFTIVNGSGSLLFRGYLLEDGLESRPAQSFRDIDDYLKAWVEQKPEDRTEMFQLSYAKSGGLDEELFGETRTILLGEGQNAWFSSFYAFESISSRIKAAAAFPYKFDRIKELRKIGRVLPGSLTELKKHLLNLKELYETRKEEFKKSPVYLWFLIEKANAVFRYFNAVIGLPEEQVRPIPNVDIILILREAGHSEENNSKNLEWVNYIKSKLRSYADHT